MGVKARMDVRDELKRAIVKELGLQDVTPEDIVDDAPLFGEGLGLDSLDAIELVVLVKKCFDVDLEDSEDAKQTFASVDALAAYIEARKH
ncbi:MAG: phosphopantetheine-binding protein [Desulfovibrio sp.]|jgi:acyl carrier protein|nr:phosphopantetheine-binding protein [Desulfovibrio sp.]